MLIKMEVDMDQAFYKMEVWSTMVNGKIIADMELDMQFVMIANYTLVNTSMTIKMGTVYNIIVMETDLKDNINMAQVINMELKF